MSATAKPKYPNLEAERARRGLTYQELANALGISRVSMWSKVTTGKFNVNECKTLCGILHQNFEYLFEEAEQDEHGQDA